MLPPAKHCARHSDAAFTLLRPAERQAHQLPRGSCAVHAIALSKRLRGHLDQTPHVLGCCTSETVQPHAVSRPRTRRSRLAPCAAPVLRGPTQPEAAKVRGQIKGTRVKRLQRHANP